MDSTQIIKRRLAELKRMSIQLKQSTQNSNQLDYNIVYSILQATKSSASKLSQPRDSESKLSNRPQSPLSRLLSMNSNTQPYKTLFPETTQEKKHKQQSTFQPRSYTRPKTQQYNQYHQPQPYQDTFDQQQPYYMQPQEEQFIGVIKQQPQHNPQHEVLNLREQNANLEKTMLTMRHQIHELKDRLDTLTKDQEWKAGLPYFKLNQNISAFYTRMKINQNDYNKIDYVPYHAQLTLDKLIVKKSSGTTTPKQIDLSELREVQYIDSIVMFLHFGVIENEKGINSANREDSKLEKNSTQEFFQNLFIKFNNEEELHRWDLALYINFKIMDSLKKDKLFLTYSRSRSKSRKRSSQSKFYDSHKKSKRSSDNIIEDDQDLMKKLVERRELYQETKRLVSERMIEKANQKKILQNSGVKKPQKDEGWYEDAEQFSQTHPFQIADDQLAFSKSKFNYIVRDQNGNEQTEGQKSERANTSKFKDLMASGKINSVNGQSVVIPGLNLSGATSLQNERGLSFNPGQHNNLSLSRKLQQERIKQATELKQQQQQKLKKVEQTIKKFTQQGYDLTKYSKDGFNPHDKRFFISSDMKELCWQEEGGKNKKSIKLQSIKEVMLEKIGQGIRKHIKKPKRQEHCIISYIKDGKMKVIQLGANSTVMAQFVDELITVIDHLKEANN